MPQRNSRDRKAKKKNRGNQRTDNKHREKEVDRKTIIKKIIKLIKAVEYQKRFYF